MPGIYYVPGTILRLVLRAKSLQACPTLCNYMGYSPPGFSCLWDSPGKNTGVGCHFLLQGIFPTQGLIPCLLCLLHCRWVLYHRATWEVSLLLFSRPQSPSYVSLLVTLWTAACQASFSLTISQSLPKFMSIALVMPSSPLIL